MPRSTISRSTRRWDYFDIKWIRVRSGGFSNIMYWLPMALFGLLGSHYDAYPSSTKYRMFTASGKWTWQKTGKEYRWIAKSFWGGDDIQSYAPKTGYIRKNLFRSVSFTWIDLVMNQLFSKFSHVHPEFQDFSKTSKAINPGMETRIDPWWMLYYSIAGVVVDHFHVITQLVN